MTTFQIQHRRPTDPPLGMGIPRFHPAAERDPHADDPDADAIRVILPLLTDNTCTLFELCHLTGLTLSRLADLLESDRVTTALNDMQRALAVRRRAVDLHAPFAADAALLNLASTTPLDAREAEPVRKAAARLRKPAPTPPRPQAKARCRASTVRGPAPRTPQPPPPGAVLRPSAAKHAAHPNPTTPPTPPAPPTSHTPTAPPPSAPRPCPDPLPARHAPHPATERPPKPRPALSRPPEVPWILAAAGRTWPSPVTDEDPVLSHRVRHSRTLPTSSLGPRRKHGIAPSCSSPTPTTPAAPARSA